MKPVAPVRKELVVHASQAICFRMFTAGIDKWWPRDHHVGDSPLKEFVLEQREGGRWYSISEDGTEWDVGTVLVWEPSTRLVLTWQLTAKWKYDPEFVTEVEVRFYDEGRKKTRVQIEHRKLEAYGPDTEAMHEMFDGDGAWVRTLATFAQRTEREPEDDEGNST